MAVLKHLSSKSSDYGKALEYLIFQHNERTQKPILDDRGNMKLRDEFYLNGLNCDPYSFDKECEKLNTYYHKNQKYNEIKAHHYILSFDPRDKEDSGLTGERAQTLGLEFANRFFVGHQALVCTHMDGHNGSGNIHVHIVINSLRKSDVEKQDFMERFCDSRAGYKHNQTRALLKAMQQGIMEITEREHLHQVDLLTPAPVKTTDREYWKNRREQEKLDALTAQDAANGIPAKTRYQSQKQFIRDAVKEISAYARSLEEFKRELYAEYAITLKESRGRFSYLHPEREKYITARKLGADFERDHLLTIFSENEKAGRQKPARPILSSDPEETVVEKSSHSNEAPRYDPSYDYTTDPISVLYFHSDLRLVVDLQSILKAQQSLAYARKVKITNLKEMAKTVCYVQEHGYDSRGELDDAYDLISEKLNESRKTLRSTEDQIKALNEQIRFVGMYYANKSVKAAFLQSKNKGKYRQEHSSELDAYETGVRFIKEQFAGKVPSLKELKAQRDELLQRKTNQYSVYQYFKGKQKELYIVQSNVEAILGKERSHSQEKVKAQDIS